MLYLIPTVIADDAIETIPAYVLDVVRSCQLFFVENERSARRFLKKLSRDIVIDAYEWHTIGKDETLQRSAFLEAMQAGRVVGLMSEAGCPGVADPGQWIVALAQEKGITVKPLVGPSSILMALMASGMNGQDFHFMGYLPIEAAKRNAAIRQAESDSARHGTTKIFIETPYRNNQLLESFIGNCQAHSRLCIAENVTGAAERIRTKRIGDWKKNLPKLDKEPVIFLLDGRR